MKKFFYLSLLLAVVLPFATAQAEQDVNRSLDADAKARVSVSTVSGSIEVEGWDRNQVQVTGTIGDDVEELIFERDGRDVIIEVKSPNSRRGRLDIDAYLHIRIPKGSSLEIGTVSANIRVQGVQGEQELDSVSGDIRTQAMEGNIEADTVSGDVDVDGARGVKGEWEFSSVSGDVTATGLSGELSMETVSGDIEVVNGAFERAAVDTVSGDIDFKAALLKSGRVEIETVNGNIDVEFLGAVSARFEVESFNGRIRNCFGPKPERTSKYAPGLELSFTEGDGAGRVSIASLNGDLSICKD
jgi:DUF4097 and DUF4098 domain-containing protein YvlB